MFFTAFIGALIGAVVGAAISVGTQLAQGKSLKTVDWRAVAGSAAQGAVTGGVAGLTLGAGALIPALGTRIAVAAGTGVVGGLLGLGASSAITGVAPTQAQIVSTVVAGALGGGLGGALVGPTAAAVLSTTPRIVAVGAGAGGVTGAAGQLVQEAATGFQPGAAGRIAEATGVGAAAGVGGAALGVTAARVLPTPVVTRQTEPTTPPANVTPTVAAEPQTVATGTPVTNNGGTGGNTPSSSIGLKGAIEQMANGDGNPSGTDGHPNTTSATPAKTTTPPNSTVATTAAERARPGPANPEGGTRKMIAQSPEASPEEATPSRTAANEPYSDWKKGIPTPALKDPLTDVAYLSREVPALENQIARLKAEGWNIRYGEPNQGSWANASKHEIVIDPSSGSPTDFLKTIAHEVGHALEAPTPVRDPHQMSRDDFINTSLHDMALSEGQAVLNEATMLEAFRKAVREQTGTSPDLPFQGQYRITALNKNLSTAQKIEQIGTRYMENEVPSVYQADQENAPNYNGYWTERFGEEWDEAHGLTPATPEATPAHTSPAAPAPH